MEAGLRGGRDEHLEPRRVPRQQPGRHPVRGRRRCGVRLKLRPNPQGIEAGWSTRLGSAQWGVNYTRLDATFRSSELLGGAGNSSNEAAADGLPGVEGNIEVHAGDRLPLVPRHLLKVFAEWPVGEALSLSADLTAVGGVYARATRTMRISPTGSTTSARVEVRATRCSTWAPVAGRARPDGPCAGEQPAGPPLDTAAQLGASAFDANGHFVARPFPANAQGDRPLVSSTFFAPGAPRSFWIGVRYTLGR